MNKLYKFYLTDIATFRKYTTIISAIDKTSAMNKAIEYKAFIDDIEEVKP